MDDALLVRGFERVGNLLRDRQGFINIRSAWGPTPTPRRTGAVPQPRAAALGFGLSTGNQRRQVVALDEFHHEKRTVPTLFQWRWGATPSAN